MRPQNLLFLLLFLLTWSFDVSAQVRKGEIIADRLRFTDSTGTTALVKVPSDSSILIYRMRGKSWIPDNQDSVNQVDKILQELINSSGIFRNLRLVCYSYNVDNYLPAAGQRPVFSKRANGLNAYYLQNEKNNSRLLNGDKLILINKRGKVLFSTPYLAAYDYKHTDQMNIVKGKLLTDKDGTKKPLANATIVLKGANTNGSTKTNESGDFEIPVPDNGEQHTLRIEPQEKDLSSVILATQDGEEHARVYMKSETFEYKLLEADVIRLSDLYVLDELTLEAGQFLQSEKSEWIRAEYITYDHSSYLIKPESQQLLDMIATIMAENPSIKLEIISHTSSEPDDASNQVLSAKRALNVYSYLVLIGVERDRMRWKGKSERELKHSLTTPTGAEKERTEFRFTK